jgi:hypothetical protein
MFRSRFARRLLAVCAVLALIAFALTVALGQRIAVAIGQFQAQITPGAVSEWVTQAMVITLEQGTPEQKLEVIRQLGEMAADARELSPSLVHAALADNDPKVRKAAAAALKKVDPDAAGQFGVD